MRLEGAEGREGIDAYRQTPGAGENDGLGRFTKDLSGETAQLQRQKDRLAALAAADSEEPIAFLDMHRMLRLEAGFIRRHVRDAVRRMTTRQQGS
jgi:hypothetical protein